MSLSDDRIETKRHGAWDSVGLAASTLCLIHCLALPLVLAALPTLAAAFGKGEVFHLVILSIAVPSSVFALWTGRMRHSAVLPLVAGVSGLALLTVALLGWLPEVAGTVAGSLLLASAHIANWSYRHGASGSLRNDVAPIGF